MDGYGEYYDERNESEGKVDLTHCEILRKGSLIITRDNRGESQEDQFMVGSLSQMLV